MFKTLSKMEKEDLVKEVDQRVRSKKTASKKARNLMLKVESWEAFEKLCKEDGVWPSEVLDEFISLYIDTRRKKASD